MPLRHSSGCAALLHALLWMKAAFAACDEAQGGVLYDVGFDGLMALQTRRLL
jgi:hypothetical protein